MIAILKAVSAPNPNIKLSLQADLRELATDYLTAALTTPLAIAIGPRDVTLTKRATWVERHLVKPAQRLLEALSDDTAPLRSEWPDPMNAPEPDRAVLRVELKKLYERADELRYCLSERASLARANHTEEFKGDLIYALTTVFRRYFPHLNASRGKQNESRFSVFLDLCAGEIFPGVNATDYRVKDVIPRRRKKRIQPKSG